MKVKFWFLERRGSQVPLLILQLILNNYANSWLLLGLESYRTPSCGGAERGQNFVISWFSPTLTSHRNVPLEEFEARNCQAQTYLLFIQHKNSEVICKPEVTFFSVDLTPELPSKSPHISVVYSRSFEMDWQVKCFNVGQTNVREVRLHTRTPSLSLSTETLTAMAREVEREVCKRRSCSQPASNREFVTYIHINVCKGMWCLAGQNVLEIEGAFSSGSWWPVIILSAASLPSTLAPDMIVKSSLPRVCTRATEISHSQTSQ